MPTQLFNFSGQGVHFGATYSDGFLLYNNKYSLIFKENDSYQTIEKTVSVCVNGNVTAGCTQSYKHADSEYICNILDCDGNLYDYINQYSWAYPLSKEQAAFLTSITTPLYLHGRGIPIFMNDTDRHSFEKVVEQIKAYAELIKEVHKRYSTLTHNEAQEMASLLLASEYEKGAARDFILGYLYGDTTLTDNDIQTGVELLALEHQNRVNNHWELLGKNLIRAICGFGI